jgi:mRNA export factor
MRQLPTQTAMATIQLPERVYCSDVMYPLAVVGLANRHMKLYKLDGNPQEYQDTESQLKHQSRCVSIFKSKETNQPAGYALGSIEGSLSPHYFKTIN